MVQQVVGAGAVEIFGRSKAPARARRGHAGSACSLHIHFTVADVYRLFVGTPECLDDLVNGSGIWFVWNPRPLPEYRVEFPIAKKVGDALHGEGMWFVGKDSQLALAIAEFIEQGNNPGIGSGEDIPLASVRFLENCQARGRFLVDFRVVLANGAANQVLHTSSDKLAIGVCLVCREPASREGLVRSGSQVVERIQERPVEVENDGFPCHVDPKLIGYQRLFDVQIGWSALHPGLNPDGCWRNIFHPPVFNGGIIQCWAAAT